MITGLSVKVPRKRFSLHECPGIQAKDFDHPLQVWRILEMERVVKSFLLQFVVYISSHFSLFPALRPEGLLMNKWVREGVEAFSHTPARCGVTWYACCLCSDAASSPSYLQIIPSRKEYINFMATHLLGVYFIFGQSFPIFTCALLYIVPDLWALHFSLVR